MDFPNLIIVFCFSLASSVSFHRLTALQMLPVPSATAVTVSHVSTYCIPSTAVGLEDLGSMQSGLCHVLAG